MTLPSLPAGLVRSLALLAGTILTLVAVWPLILPMLCTSDIASVTTLVGGCALIAWSVAQASQVTWLTPARAFGAGLALPAAIPLLLPRRRRAANDNHFFNGSLPQFISE